MRLLSFSSGNYSSYGAVTASGIVDLGVRLEAGSLRALIARGELGLAASAADSQTADFSLDEVHFRPPVPDPGKIVCIGVNYGRRNAEYADDSEAPAYPSVFMRTPESLVGHREPIWDPPESGQLDYEGEIAIVIGKPGRRIPRERALGHIAGLSLINEGSVRDWLRHAKFNVTQGKNFERSGSFGPWLVTPDEQAPDRPMRLTTKVNGELRQDDTTDNMIFPFDYLISYLSTFMPLNPGDVIASGTPTGAGARFDPPRYLRAGDVVEVCVEGIGTLCNAVIDEPAA